MKHSISQRKARIAFVVPHHMRENLLAWAKQENRTTANLVYSIVYQALEKREQQHTHLLRKELFHD